MSGLETEIIIIEPKDKGQRLDIFLKKSYPKFSRAYFQKLIKDNEILVNDNIEPGKYKLKTDDVISINFKDIELINKVEPEDIDLDIIYEDESIIIINKPYGMVVHPACGNTSGTLVNALIHHFKELPVSSCEDGFIRPGLVHRLDKNTSGIMIIAKTEDSLFSLSKQFEKREIEKTYLAICVAKNDAREGVINVPIARSDYDRKKMSVSTAARAKEAVTYFKVMKELGDGLLLIEAKPKTGRTHQIRLHLKYIGYPILGDPEYGVSIVGLKDIVKRSMLHAYSLKFIHPKTNKEMLFYADFPDDFSRLLKRFSG